MAPLDRDVDLSLARLSCSLVPASANKNKLQRQTGHNLPVNLMAPLYKTNLCRVTRSKR